VCQHAHHTTKVNLGTDTVDDDVKLVLALSEGSIELHKPASRQNRQDRQTGKTNRHSGDTVDDDVKLVLALKVKAALNSMNLQAGQKSACVLVDNSMQRGGYVEPRDAAHEHTPSS
jgi:hypothetical protein